jgi:hypothetical protein
MMPRQAREEALARAYVRALAAMSGAIFVEYVQDFGIDVSLRAVDEFGGGYSDFSRQIDLQLKSTTRAGFTETEVTLDLEPRKYNRLCVTGRCPRFLVMLALPADETEWLTQSPEALTLRKCAYWLALEGRPFTTATSNIRVRFPRGNVFSVDVIHRLLAADGGIRP